MVTGLNSVRRDARIPLFLGTVLKLKRERASKPPEQNPGIKALNTRQ